GPVRVNQVQSPHMLYDALRDAASAAGHKPIDDPYAERQDGVSRVEVTIGNGVRQSTARTYLAQAAARPNLTIITGARTSRILIDKRRATGVEYRRDGKTERAHAAREVIVSSGAYGSPQVLMLSGIGPADHLREAGVAVAHD